MATGLSSIHSKITIDSTSPTGAVWVIASKSKVGLPAGTLNKKNGYYMTSFAGKSYYIHRLIMELQLGRRLATDEQVDHIDRCKTNNALSNLRVVDSPDNQHNRGAQANSCTGVKGLSWSKKDSAWCGHIKYRGKRYAKQSKDKQAVLLWLEQTRASLNSI